MSEQLIVIQNTLQLKASAETIASLKKFVPGSQQIYGVKMPVLNELAKQFKSGGFELVEELWLSGAYEEKLLAIKILEKISGKDPGRALKLVEHFSPGIDNWAICDAIGMQALKPIVKTHQEEIFRLSKKYSISYNMWQRRLSLVLVEWYTRNRKFHPAINSLVRKLENDKEYYVKKAVDWLKRNIAKRK